MEGHIQLENRLSSEIFLVQRLAGLPSVHDGSIQEDIPTFLHGRDLKLHKHISRKYKSTHFLLSQTPHTSGVTLMTLHMRTGKMQGVWMERDNCSLNIFNSKITKAHNFVSAYERILRTRGALNLKLWWFYCPCTSQWNGLCDGNALRMRSLSILRTVYLRFRHPLMLNSEWNV